MAMAAHGVGEGLLRPSVGAFTAEITPPEIRGLANSLQRQATSMLALLGPVSFGVVADLSSCPTAILLGSGLMMATHVAYWRLAAEKATNRRVKSPK